jgi:hypothetical protein
VSWSLSRPSQDSGASCYVRVPAPDERPPNGNLTRRCLLSHFLPFHLLRGRAQTTENTSLDCYKRGGALSSKRKEFPSRVAQKVEQQQMVQWTEGFWLGANQAVQPVPPHVPEI